MLTEMKNKLFFKHKSSYNFETTYFRTYLYIDFFFFLSPRITSRNTGSDFTGTVCARARFIFIVPCKYLEKYGKYEKILIKIVWYCISKGM